MAVFITNDPTPHLSEYELFCYLKKGLPDDWVVIGNLNLPYENGVIEIDAVVISRNLIWVLEAKNWFGEITGDEHSWHIQHPQYPPKDTRSPVISTSFKGKVLASRARVSKIKCWVDYVVVMTAKPDLKTPPDPRIVFKEQIIDALLNWKPGGRPCLISPEELQSFIKNIGGETMKNMFLQGGIDPELRERQRYGGKQPQKPAVRMPTAARTDETPEKERHEIYITFSQDSFDFTRTYYNSEYKKVLLGKGELRGSQPPLWRNWGTEGAYLHLLDDGFKIESLPQCECVLNGKVIPAGSGVDIIPAKGEVTICGITMRYNYTEYQGV